jgi:glutaredoxin
MSDITLTLIGKPGCHLCDDARVAVKDVVDALSSSRLVVTEVSIEDDQALFDEYWEQIPVLLINGKVHNFWRIDPMRLSTSLKGIL